MEIEEAIKKLRFIGNGVPVGNIQFGMGKEEYNNIFFMGANALEKQVPKRTISCDFTLEKCPCCNSLKVNMEEACCGGLHKFSYCPDCGQAIDRSDSVDNT